MSSIPSRSAGGEKSSFLRLREQVLPSLAGPKVPQGLIDRACPKKKDFGMELG